MTHNGGATPLNSYRLALFSVGKLSSDSRFLFKNFAVPVTWLQLGLDRSTAPRPLNQFRAYDRAGAAPNFVTSKITQLAY